MRRQETDEVWTGRKQRTWWEIRFQRPKQWLSRKEQPAAGAGGRETPGGTRDSSSSGFPRAFPVRSPTLSHSISGPVLRSLATAQPWPLVTFHHIPDCPVHMPVTKPCVSSSMPLPHRVVLPDSERCPYAGESESEAHLAGLATGRPIIA